MFYIVEETVNVSLPRFKNWNITSPTIISNVNIKGVELSDNLRGGKDADGLGTQMSNHIIQNSAYQ